MEHFSGLCNPVPLFLMISGYGLYSSYAQRGSIKVGKRILNLYLHLWIIYLIFVPIGSYVKPADYPGGLLCFIENATSWHVTYNGEQWFLFPYIIILLTSSLIFKVADKTKPALLLGVTMLIYVTYCVSIKKWGGGMELYRSWWLLGVLGIWFLVPVHNWHLFEKVSMVREIFESDNKDKPILQVDFFRLASCLDPC